MSIKLSLSTRNLSASWCKSNQWQFDQTFAFEPPLISTKLFFCRPFRPNTGLPCGVCRQTLVEQLDKHFNCLKPFLLLSLYNVHVCFTETFGNQNSWHFFLLRHTDSNYIPKKLIYLVVASFVLFSI